MIPILELELSAFFSQMTRSWKKCFNNAKIGENNIGQKYGNIEELFDETHCICITILIQYLQTVVNMFDLISNEIYVSFSDLANGFHKLVAIARCQH